MVSLVKMAGSGPYDEACLADAGVTPARWITSMLTPRRRPSATPSKSGRFDDSLNRARTRLPLGYQVVDRPHAGCAGAIGGIARCWPSHGQIHPTANYDDQILLVRWQDSLDQRRSSLKGLAECLWIQQQCRCGIQTRET